MAIDGNLLVKLVHEGNWTAVASETGSLDAASEVAPFIYFSRGKALLELGRPVEALQSIQAGRSSALSDQWGSILYFEALLALHRVDEAFQALETVIDTASTDMESAKAIYVDKALDHSRFEIAAAMNEKRAVIQPDPPKKLAIAVQCFNKPDTLDGLFTALVACQDTYAFDLVIGQDNVIGSARQAEYAQPAAEVRSIIARWLPQLMEKFGSVDTMLFQKNRGTAPTCRLLLDRVTQTYDAFLFLEDDCILAADALRWTRHHLEHNVGLDKYWFVACESIFFDSGGRGVSTEHVQQMKRYAARDDVHSAYVELDFVPSTCFATTTVIWTKMKNFRSFPHGPESLNKFTKTHGYKTLAPVVPRAKDIGMLHEKGYSVVTLGRENVKEIKETYLDSNGVFHEPAIHLFAKSSDLLWSASSSVNRENILKLIAGDAVNDEE